MVIVGLLGLRQRGYGEPEVAYASPELFGASRHLVKRANEQAVLAPPTARHQTTTYRTIRQVTVNFFLGGSALCRQSGIRTPTLDTDVLLHDMV